MIIMIMFTPIITVAEAEIKEWFKREISIGSIGLATDS